METEDKPRCDKLDNKEMFSYIHLNNITSVRDVAKAGKKDSRIREYCVVKGASWLKEVKALISYNEMMMDKNPSLIELLLQPYLDFLDSPDDAETVAPPATKKRGASTSLGCGSSSRVRSSFGLASEHEDGVDDIIEQNLEPLPTCGCGYYDKWVEIVDDNLEEGAEGLAEEFVIWALTGRVRGNWFFFYGPGGTGKSYCTVYAIHATVGDRAWKGPASVKGSHPQERLAEEPKIKVFAVDESTMGFFAAIFGDGSTYFFFGHFYSKI